MNVNDKLPVALTPREGVPLPLVCHAHLLLLPDAPGLRHRLDLRAAVPHFRSPERLSAVVLAGECAQAHPPRATNSSTWLFRQRQGRNIKPVDFDRSCGADPILAKLVLQARWNGGIARLQLWVRRGEVAGFGSRLHRKDRDCCERRRARRREGWNDRCERRDRRGEME